MERRKFRGELNELISSDPKAAANYEELQKIAQQNPDAAITAINLLEDAGLAGDPALQEAIQQVEAGELVDINPDLIEGIGHDGTPIEFMTEDYDK